MQQFPQTLPSMIYGTAWKEEQTESLTRMAIEAGFVGIDTANQRRHYVEAAVGRAIARVIDQGLRQRSELFVQTKFTFADGQDHRIPYDPRADYGTQVRQSFQSSLAHLQTPYIDSYVLHGPSSRHGLTEADWQVWRELEVIHRSGRVRYLGVSNISAAQLQSLLSAAEVKPTFVQNRCFARLGWDRQVRVLCREHDMVYQGFSLLTANPHVFSDPRLQAIARELEKTPAQVVFRFALQSGMIPLTGTTDRRHMEQDLACSDFSLADEDVRHIEQL